FAPGIEGAPPIHGSGDVVLDVYPKEAVEAPELGAFLGAELRPGSQGLQIVSLVPEGRLARAGAKALDHVVSMDGLSVLGESDLEPRAGQRTARVGIAPDGAAATDAPLLLSVDVSGYKPLPAADFRWTLAWIVP